MSALFVSRSLGGLKTKPQLQAGLCLPNLG